MSKFWYVCLQIPTGGRLEMARFNLINVLHIRIKLTLHSKCWLPHFAMVIKNGIYPCQPKVLLKRLKMFLAKNG
jgi:hypothetical protein